MISRRQFIKSLALAAGYSLLPLGKYGFAIGADAPVAKRLVVVLLRGAVDGLNVVVPYKEQEYYARRTSIALQPPGQAGGVVDLDGFFGLHPSLTKMMPLWQNKSLAFIHASGIPNNVRSHFEAQDIMETASLQHNVTQDGWMNTLLSFLPNNNSSTRALSFSGAQPRILMGKGNVATVSGGLKPDSKNAFGNPHVENAFSQLYANQPQLSNLMQEAVSSREKMIDDLKKEMIAANNNAPFPDGFPGQATRLAAMIKQDQGIQLAFMDIGGWDTHADQGNDRGALANSLAKLGDGLSILAQKLGEHYQDTMILVMSEFGRTVAENGNRGTDHGHGNVMFLMGGAVKGGKVYARWPGLSPNKLFEGRDLAITTDFRSVIGAVLNRHLGVDDRNITQILQGYQPDDGIKAIIGDAA